MRVALAQIDPTVGDIDGNAAKIAEWIGRARAEGAELAIFPELCVPGYPAEDLYLKRHFVEANRRAVEELAGEARGLTALVGFAEPVAGGGDFRRAHNSLAVLADGEVRAVYRKNRLPNYSVFDEQRYFVPGAEPATVEVAGQRVGLTVCEDVWAPGPPASERGGGGSGSDREPFRLARTTAARAASAKRCSPSAPAPTAPTSPSATSSAARTSWSSTGTASSSTPRATSSPAPRSSRRSCWSARSPPPLPAASPSRCPTWPRSTRRCPSACATTCSRTASATSASPSRGASTPPWWPCSPSTPSAPSTSAVW